MTEQFPWCWGRTVGRVYGQNKRLIKAVEKGDEDPRWLGFIAHALRGEPIPSRLQPYIEPFEGTEMQKRMLMDMLEDARQRWQARMEGIVAPYW